MTIPATIWAGAVAADWTTTYRFSSEYSGLLHERNPIVNGLEGHPAWMIATGAAIDAASAWAAYEVFGRRHPRLMKAALYGAAAYRTYLALYNLRMMREAHSIRIAATPVQTQ